MKKLFLNIALALALVSGLGACTQIDTGNVGVARTFGKTNMEELLPGVQFTGMASVDEFTTKEVALQLQDLKPKAADNLTMADVDVDIYFQANPALVADTLVRYQGDVYKDKSGGLVAGYSRLNREAREAVNASIATFPATTMHTKRPELAAMIQKRLQSELDRTDKGVWTITAVNVVNLATDPGIEKSIRAVAEMDQAVARANKEAELAKANAIKVEIEASGQARANRIISDSLTDRLIRLREIEAQVAFAGAGTHTVLLGGASNTSMLIGK